MSSREVVVVVSFAALVMASLNKRKRKPLRWWRTELYKKRSGSELMLDMKSQYISRQMLANSSPASTPSRLELSIPLCSSKKPTLGGSVGAVQERLVRRSGPRPNYTNRVHERLHYRLGSQVYTHLIANPSFGRYCDHCL
jgi:hypothetical protein